MVLYSAVSSPLDRSKRFTLFAFPDRPVHSDTVLGFSWKHSNGDVIAYVDAQLFRSYGHSTRLLFCPNRLGLYNQLWSM